MDGERFDALVRGFGGRVPRRGALRLLAVAGPVGLLGLADGEARRRKKRKKRKEPPEPCGAATCASGRFCCDDEREVCCANGSECCNPGPGTGSCCPSPNRCGRPYGNDAAPNECCPPERQWFTTTGLVRCCPAGTRSLGTGITSDDGPCCPEEKYCSTSPTGGKCCGDSAPICVDRSAGRCCTEADKCGTDCCGFGRTCCNGKCCPFGQICDGGACKCPSGVRQCGDTCCHAAAVGCEGSRCLNWCDLNPPCGG